MSTTPMIPMLAPDGTAGDIPQDHVQDATRAGFKLAAELTAPNGQVGLVPMERVHEAIRSGFLLRGSSPLTPAQATSSIGQTMQPFGASGPGAGKLTGLPGVNPHSPTAGEVVGDAALAASPQLAAFGLKPAVGAAVYGMGKEAIKSIPYIAASEGINYVRQNVPAGKYLPPGSELIPFFLAARGGGESPAIPKKQPAIEPTDVYRPGYRTPRAYYGGQPAEPIPTRNGLMLSGETIPVATMPPVELPSRQQTQPGQLMRWLQTGAAQTPSSFPPDLPRYNPVIPAARNPVGFSDVMEDQGISQQMAQDLEAHGIAAQTQVNRENWARNTVQTTKADLIKQVRQAMTPADLARLSGASVNVTGPGQLAAVAADTETAANLAAALKRAGIPFKVRNVGGAAVRFDFRSTMKAIATQ